MRTWKSILLLFIASHASATPAAIGPVAANFVLDGAINEWTQQPPTLSLIPKIAAARPGNIWIAQSLQGLVIAGRVEGAQPHFAKNPADMPNGDHVEVWLALADDIPLPPIGWYNKFGTAGPDDENSLLNSDSDKKTAWLAKQRQYRRQLLRLFMRQWQLAPDVAAETYALPAFAALTGGADLQTLFPCGQPLTRFSPPMRTATPSKFSSPGKSCRRPDV
jgi:hypothetical protein